MCTELNQDTFTGICVCYLHKIRDEDDHGNSPIVAGRPLHVALLGLLIRPTIVKPGPTHQTVGYRYVDLIRCLQ